MHYKLFDTLALEVLRKIQQSGFASWFVGGCVRNALLDQSISDYDIATTAKPSDLISVFKDQCKIDAKGIAFGSIRINYQNLWLEITTLRQDINQDGRHTEVIFTTDLAKDVERRDFTVNALYWDGNETSPIIDLVNGQADLNARIIRFIGNADDRVQEDYLRILRFFRFSAIYGKNLEQTAIKACTKHQQGLQHLSGDRIWPEWSKMLLQQNTMMSLQAINTTGIALTLFGSELNINALADYKGNDPLLLTRLLLPHIHLEHLAHRFNLNSTQKAWLKYADLLALDHDFRRSYLQYGELAKELVSYWATKYHQSANIKLSQPFWQVANPTFPISGKDLLQLDCLPGPIVGSYLSRAHDWWLHNNFTPNKKECLAYVRSIFEQ